MSEQPISPPRLQASPVLSWPNILTYARIAAVPALVAAFFFTGDFARWTGLAIFVAAAITDYFDGYLARTMAQGSALGRMLDPIADKLLVAAALLMLTGFGTISGYSQWAAVIILAREILVSGLREFLAELQVSVPVSRLAKWKTVVQMVAIGFLLAGETGDRLVPGALDFGIGLLWAAALITIYTGYDYFKAGVGKLVEERE
ncbi:MAG: CDP-diacylglycerol--glycerol-3-phosphate 3-phosphatidyltransferase [Alphaproteobacteria bacterium]